MGSSTQIPLLEQPGEVLCDGQGERRPASGWKQVPGARDGPEVMDSFLGNRPLSWGAARVHLVLPESRSQLVPTGRPDLARAVPVEPAPVVCLWVLLLPTNCFSAP